MSDTDNAQKTEEPTPRRLEKAREEGQVGRSREVNSWLILGGGTLVLATLGPTIAGQIQREILPLITKIHTISATPLEMVNMAKSIGFVILLFVLLPCLLISLSSVFANIFQHGFLITAKPLEPKLNRLSLLQGLKRIFSREQAFEFLKGLIKVTIVGLAGGIALFPHVRNIRAVPRMDVSQVDDLILLLLVKVLTVMLVVYFFIAIADAIFQNFSHRRRLRMSRQEVKDEFKQSEGDPHIKSRVRQIRMERHRKRLTESMGRADVVVTNPTHFAIALEYKMETMNAPIVVAKGQEYRALLIRRLAEEANLPIIEDPPLARTLFAVCEENQEIAPEQYEAVAGVISALYRTAGKKPS